MIDEGLKRMLEPLERFEAVRRRVARLGSRLCDLSYANFPDGPQQDALDVLRQALDDGRAMGLQYAPFGGQTLARRAIADALRAEHSLPVTYADIVLTPGAMAALHLALRVAGSPGDEVVVPVPCWLDHPLYVDSLGLRARLVPLGAPEFDLDLDAIERAVTERTCAILLTNPNNPTGRLIPADTARLLSGVLAAAEMRIGRPITVIADETHRDFCPPGTFAPLGAAAERTLTVYSFGKRHFMQGQRLGYVAVSPNHPERHDIAAELVRWARITGTATPTALMQRAVPGLLGLALDDAGIHEGRRYLRRGLEDLGYRVVPSEATLFLYVETPPGLDDLEFVERLAGHGVLVIPAACFHHDGYVRLSVTGGAGVLERAIEVFGRLSPVTTSTEATA